MARIGQAASDIYQKMFGKVTPEASALEHVSVEQPTTQKKVRAERERKPSPGKRSPFKAGTSSKGDETKDDDKNVPDSSTGHRRRNSHMEEAKRRVKKAFNPDNE